MKGLFYKDFCYIKESKFLLVFLVVFGFGFSYFYKNPNFVLGYFSIFPSIMLMSTLNYDSYNHGLTTLFTLPINRKDYLKQKYLLGFILGIFFLIIASTSYYQIEHSFKFINNDLQHITIPKYHNFIKKNISSSSSLPVTSFFSKKIYQSFAEFKNCTTFASAIKQHGRLAQLVQSIWFTPRGSGVRIPQRPPRDS